MSAFWGKSLIRSARSFLLISSTKNRFAKGFGKVFGRNSECTPHHHFHARESKEIIDKAEKKLPSNAVSDSHNNTDRTRQQTKKRSSHARGIGSGQTMYAYAGNVDNGFEDTEYSRDN